MCVCLSVCRITAATADFLVFVCLCVGPVGQSDITPAAAVQLNPDPLKAKVNDVIHPSSLSVSLSLSARVLWSIQPD